MTIALYVVAGLLVALLVISAGLKLSGKPAVLESYARVGVAADRLPLLACVILAGAGGIAGGILWTPLGVAAAAALALYFALALAAHATHHDMSHAATPAVLLLLAVGAAVLFGLEL
ncbi:MAG: DoxX family protein [Acidimicrobiales bacterium]